jgi:hypothetical protein
MTCVAEIEHSSTTAVIGMLDTKISLFEDMSPPETLIAADKIGIDD